MSTSQLRLTIMPTGHEPGLPQTPSHKKLAMPLLTAPFDRSNVSSFGGR